MKTDTVIHRRAEQILRAAGYTPMRQFAPQKDHAIKDEHFEVWAAPDPITRLVFIHFYGDNGGFDCYYPDTGKDASTWAATETKLKAFAS